jgi:Predicted deacylase
MLRSLRLFLVSLLILAFLPAFAAAQRSPFAVGTASAAPGQKANGYLEVPAGADTGTNIPVVVVNGANPGPVLALVTGAHGTEYVSIIAVEKLIADLDPATISAPSS